MSFPNYEISWNYDTINRFLFYSLKGGKTRLKMVKKWPSLITIPPLTPCHFLILPMRAHSSPKFHQNRMNGIGARKGHTDRHLYIDWRQLIHNRYMTVSITYLTHNLWITFRATITATNRIKPRNTYNIEHARRLTLFTDSDPEKNLRSTANCNLGEEIGPGFRGPSRNLQTANQAQAETRLSYSFNW